VGHGDEIIRREPRFVSATQVEMSIADPSEFHTLWTENISRGGMFIRTESPPPVGTKIGIRINVQQGVLAFSGTVVHAVDRAQARHLGRTAGIGVKFDEIPEQARQSLERYVQLIQQRAASQPRAPQPQTDDSKLWVLGIDLGTSNTAAVAVGPDNKPISVIRSERQRGPILPSIVNYKNMQHPVVGWSARDMLLTDPLTTVFGWKRFIGRSEKNEFVSRHRVRFPFRVGTDTRGEIGAVIGDLTVSFVDVAADILMEVRARARAITQRDITKAVIAVPAHFSTSQRRTVYEAGRRAGLEVLRLVNEPTVAALSFGVGRSMNHRILIYDFGGGSFDATLVEVTDDVFDAKATSGDNFLGGLDLDRAVMEKLTQLANQQHKIDVREEPVVAQRFLNAAENAKIALSDQPKTKIRIPMIGFDRRGQEADLDYEMGRDELERLTAPLIEKTIGIVEDMLRGAGFSKDNVDLVILVGGQSHMPLVEKRVAAALGQQPHLHPGGDAAVASGAALVAKSAGDLAAPVLLDTLSVGIGVMLPGGGSGWVFERGCSLPARARIPIRLMAPNAVLGFWEATHLTSPDREMLSVAKVPPHVPVGDAILVATLSENLELGAWLEVSGSAIPLTLSKPGVSR
jgi:molecular chaperone DnaK